MNIQPKLNTSNGARTSRKRKASSPFQEEDCAKPKKSQKKVDTGEKRLRRFRAKPPQNFSAVYDRATSQRFYVLERTRAGTAYCPEEFVELTGSTGNIYVTHIAQQPTCTCPHAQSGHQCKHIIYVLSRVLRARFDLVYQLALLATELQEILENAPPIETEGQSGAETYDKNRKSLEDDCPICFTPFEGAEDAVYCRATCGQNIHKECFEMWAVTKRKSTRDQVTCPMCRTPWQGDDDTIKKIKNKGVIGSDGYVNVADQLGISRTRDYSTYYDGPRRGEGYRRWW
ncbi:hypothetical protein F5Y00DRAFT_202894 [Daldinia vernicosa]|uniref:uncharacterized protein n=1 Tax=Daldinia vernicosa TaxID=114800 RepID=UPI0020083FDE|nr:uncharacterized protein F5Y00DRAFT_202894 [Daldinia vernicosa]KAI0844279.1 hypothetical protein F5Y00DRAFT_202894 [Daldinia vernicosa]